MALRSRCVVVARVAYEVERVRGSGRFFKGWGYDYNARFWRIWFGAGPCLTAREVREELLSVLPEGCNALVGLFPTRAEYAYCSVEQAKGETECWRKHGVCAEALVDVGFAKGAVVRRRGARANLLETAAAMPCLWEREECWKRKAAECSIGNCAGEVVWALQERMQQEAVDVAGDVLVERERDCIVVVTPV
jgi:hypothetical protein